MNSINDCKEITGLDLDPIKVKLMHKESGEGWSRAQADAVEAEYRRYLYLMKFFPNEPIAPLAEVDIFWHYHILDTMKYAVDCEEIFGYFLHHFPYVGLRADEEDHAAAADRMSTLYEQTFGEPYGLSANKPAYSVRVPQETLAGGAGKTAYSVRVPQDEVAVSAGRSAYSVRVPQEAVAGRDGTAAYSVRVPQDAVTGSLRKPAYSVRVPNDAIVVNAGQTAYSVRIPQIAVASSRRETAYSVRVPQDAAMAGAGQNAYSVRVPQHTPFKMERPTLAAA